MGKDYGPIGLVPPHPERKPHPCNGLSAQVHVGDGAFMSIVHPTADPSIGWLLTWADAEVVRFVAASLIDSYNYLLSGEINTTEAIRRLRIMRNARRQALTGEPG